MHHIIRNKFFYLRRQQFAIALLSSLVFFLSEPSFDKYSEERSSSLSELSFYKGRTGKVEVASRQNMLMKIATKICLGDPEGV